VFDGVIKEYIDEKTKRNKVVLSYLKLLSCHLEVETSIIWLFQQDFIWALATMAVPVTALPTCCACEYEVSLKNGLSMK
jgi:hypothetical protein